MNPHQRILLRDFEVEIENQCRFILMADILLQHANELPMRPVREGGFTRAEQIQFAVRSLLIAAANVSKLAWGNGSGTAEAKQWREVERTELRADLGIAKNSPSCDVKLRHDFEHIDTRLEKQRQDFPMGNLNMGGISRGVPHDEIIGVGDPFGHYFRDTGLIIFWSPFGKHSVSVPDLVAEARRLLAVIESARMNRRGWIPPDEFLALQEELKEQNKRSPPPGREADHTARSDSPPTDFEVPLEES